MNSEALRSAALARSYKVLLKAQIRAGFEMDSDKAGLLTKGEDVEVRTCASSLHPAVPPRARWPLAPALRCPCHPLARSHSCVFSFLLRGGYARWPTPPRVSWLDPRVGVRCSSAASTRRVCTACASTAAG